MRPRTRVTAAILIRPRHSHCSLYNIGQSWVSRRGLHTRTCHISLRRILGQPEEAPFLIKRRKLRKQSFCLAKPTHVIRSDGQDGMGAKIVGVLPYRCSYRRVSYIKFLRLSGPCAPMSLCKNRIDAMTHIG